MFRHLDLNKFLSRRARSIRLQKVLTRWMTLQNCKRITSQEWRDNTQYNNCFHVCRNRIYNNNFNKLSCLFSSICRPFISKIDIIYDPASYIICWSRSEQDSNLYLWTFRFKIQTGLKYHGSLVIVNVLRS